MRGSGIYSQEVSHEAFTCENEECLKDNEANEVATDDWGNYDITCLFCGVVYESSSIKADKDDYYASNY